MVVMRVGLTVAQRDAPMVVLLVATLAELMAFSMVALLEV
jgi:hypothetical protein